MDKKISILELIPQRPPIVMVGELIKWEKFRYKTSFDIKNNNIFLQDKTMSECGLIENMAQSAASGIGYEFICKDKVIPIGYIAAIKKLEVGSLPKVGETIETEIINIGNFNKFSVVNAQIYNSKGIKIAQCQMSIFLDL